MHLGNLKRSFLRMLSLIFRNNVLRAGYSNAVKLIAMTETELTLLFPPFTMLRNISMIILRALLRRR